MARHETDREDLMAEATALVPRAELVLAGRAEPVVAGFRTGGHWSVYFGGDPVYHFDRSGGLRRAFVGGSLYRSQGQTLARLDRSRTEGKVELSRHDLEPAELDAFLADMGTQLGELKAALECGSVAIVRQVPHDVDFKMRLQAAVETALGKKLSRQITKR